MKKEIKTWEERFDKEFCEMKANNSTWGGTIPLPDKDLVADIKQFIRQIYDEAVQEGYNRGRLRCLQQGGCREEVQFLVQKFLEAIPRENKMTYQESDSEGTDGEIKGWNICREEIKKNMEKIINKL